MTAPPAALRVQGVRKAFASAAGEVVALDGIDLEVAPGEFVCLLGPSGCGKSTLLNAVAGFSPPTAGELTALGRAVTGRPLATTVPEVGGEKPATALRSVDFPQPDGPSRHTNSPGATSRSMPSSATTSAPPEVKTFRTPRTAIAGAAVTPRAPGASAAASGSAGS